MTCCSPVRFSFCTLYPLARSNNYHTSPTHSIPPILLHQSRCPRPPFPGAKGTVSIAYIYHPPVQYNLFPLQQEMQISIQTMKFSPLVQPDVLMTQVSCLPFSIYCEENKRDVLWVGLLIEIGVRVVMGAGCW